MPFLCDTAQARWRSRSRDACTFTGCVQRYLQHIGPTSRISSCLVTAQALQRVQRSTKQDMQLARKQLHLAKAQLAEVRRTAHADPTTAPGFCVDINRNLMVPVPSKPVQVSERHETVHTCSHRCSELKT